MTGKHHLILKTPLTDFSIPNVDFSHSLDKRFSLVWQPAPPIKHDVSFMGNKWPKERGNQRLKFAIQLKVKAHF